MTTIRLLGAVVLVLVSSGCLVEGADCSGGAVCVDGSRVLGCENGKLHEFACPGAAGCTTNASTKAVFCDFRGVQSGWQCPTFAAEAKAGLCVDQNNMVTCKPVVGDSIKYWTPQHCSSCTTSGLASLCNP